MEDDVYCIVDFEDGLQMIPTSWLIKDKNAAYWPKEMSYAKFLKAVQKRILPEDHWAICDIKKILATASK